MKRPATDKGPVSMVMEKQRTSPEAFNRFVQQPEHSDTLYELIAGEIVEMVSDNKSSRIAARILGYIFAYLIDNPIGEVTGADGGYVIGDGRYIPDVAYARHEVFQAAQEAGYLLAVPELVVEVVSPTVSPHRLNTKIIDYVQAGAVVWVIYPESREVHVHRPNSSAIRLQEDATLDGGESLPGFALPIQSIFQSSSSQPG